MAIRKARKPASARKSGGTILFTGFPGFIGARLIPRLLELRPSASIECLVQEKFLAAADSAVAALAVAKDVGTRINVEGTKNVLAFLDGAPRLERVDYVSTAYVSGSAVGTYRETDLDVGQSFKNHYEETKFLAEVAVKESGLPAAIYRPAIVVGDSKTGETAKFDGPYFALNAMSILPSPGAFLRI